MKLRGGRLELREEGCADKDKKSAGRNKQERRAGFYTFVKFGEVHINHRHAIIKYMSGNAETNVARPVVKPTEGHTHHSCGNYLHGVTVDNGKADGAGHDGYPGLGARGLHLAEDALAKNEFFGNGGKDANGDDADDGVLHAFELRLHAEVGKIKWGKSETHAETKEKETYKGERSTARKPLAKAIKRLRRCKA